MDPDPEIVAEVAQIPVLGGLYTRGAVDSVMMRPSKFVNRGLPHMGAGRRYT